MTTYTSFVAVDRSRAVGDGAPEIVGRPVDGRPEADADRDHR